MGNFVGGEIKKARLASKLNVHQAARYASVSWRAWRAWESDSVSKRKPSAAALRLFLLRAGIPIPNSIRAYLDPHPTAQVISITSSKGGVGKSPITVNVAACLVSKGLRVAVITDDCVFQSMVEGGEGPETNSLVSAVDIYDLRDVVIHPSEVTQLAKQIDRNLASCPDREIAQLFLKDDIETLKRKQQATQTINDIKKKYDYVLLDVRYEPKLIKNHCDIVALIVDSNCMQSVRAAGRFSECLTITKSRKRTPKIFTLITNYDIAGQHRELIEFIGGRKDISVKTIEKLRSEWFSNYAHREKIYKKIRELPIPLLNTKMTPAHEVVIESYNEERSIWDGYCYFHSLPDIAPHSPAAAECMSLTEELIDLRL